MNEVFFEIRDLSVLYDGNDRPAVDGVTLALRRGETVGLIGESGSGKSTLALASLGLLPDNAVKSGGIYYKGKAIHQLPEKEWNRIRWNHIALVFQNSLNVFNPLLTVEEQIGETLIPHGAWNRKQANDRISSLLRLVDLDSKWKKAYPHQLSGGMRQKVLIAMALSCDPDVLIVDEPTMALDAEAKHLIINLIIELQRQRGFALLVISHELEIIMKMAATTMVIYSGRPMEVGPTAELMTDPRHPYTRGLAYSSPSLNPYRDMWGIPEGNTATGKGGCPFRSRCSQSIPRCSRERPELEITGRYRQVSCLQGGIVTLLRAEHIGKTYSIKKEKIIACYDCSVELRSGEITALIGESGSGKTTMAEMISGTLEADSGSIYFMNRKVLPNRETACKGGIQIVYQDPLSSINNRFTVAEAIREPLDILGEDSPAIRKEAVIRTLQQAGLPWDRDFLNRRCRTMSGGQIQRIAVARAMTMNPRLLIADEISAMLDPSTAANLLRLLKDLQNRNGFSMLYITHDISLARKIADRVIVMKDGAIKEEGPLSRVFTSPRAEYTKRLIAHSLSLISPPGDSDHTSAEGDKSELELLEYCGISS